MSEYHVLPTEDLRDHVQAKDCWCCPIRDDEESNVWIHHSMDRREEYEEGRQLS